MLAVSAGANVKAVQRMLGHASAAVTLDVYADLFDDDLDSVATALNRPALQSDAANLNAKGRVGRFGAGRQAQQNPRMTGGFAW